MTRAEADVWRQNSVYREDAYHTTPVGNAAGIRERGFDLSIVAAGRMYGNGVYLALDQATQGYYERFWKTLGQEPVTLRLAVNLRKLLTIDVPDVGSFTPYTVAETAGLTTSYTRIFTEHRATLGHHDAAAAALTETLVDAGFDALVLIQRAVTQLVGGSQMIVFDPRRVTVIE